MKKYLIFAASALALASCSSDDFLGDNPGNEQNATTAINFGGEAGKITRANLSQAEAVNALNKNFVVYGYKTKGTTLTTVYDHYNIAWKGEDNKTETNTKGWEYVGVNKNPLSTVNEQTIKYWDYSADQYDFVAFSLGSNTQGTGEDKVDATKVEVTKVEDTKGEATKVTTKASYSLTGKTANLAKCLIADRITAKNKGTKKDYKLCAYGDNVTFAFRSFATKVKMGIYETIPGYSVKDVKFYKNAEDANPDETPALYANKESIPADDAKATVNVTFGSNSSTEGDINEAKVNWNVPEGSKKSSTIAFETLSTQTKEKDEKTTGNVFIGRDVTTVSMPTNFKTIPPAVDNVGFLTLKVDYTLESIDGSGEEIKVKGAQAVVPGIYTKWQPNFAYTYIFKISDQTNGSTGTGTDPAGLYPIVFDAVVTEGIQNTITTVDDPSITFYAKGALSAEYDKGTNIYVSVRPNDLKLTNCALYTVTANDMNITEASVANCLVNGKKDETNNTWTITDGSKNLVVTAATGLSIVYNIDASDTPDGKDINSGYGFAKFTAATAGTYYAFEYTYNSKKYYKVIKVKDETPAP